jgi:hypothetical protein
MKIPPRIPGSAEPGTLFEMRGRPAGRFLGEMTLLGRPGESLLYFYSSLCAPTPPCAPRPPSAA